ncbi:MAG: FliM/FliN family flagellar motor switch protein [Sphingomonadales bacterium]
MSATPSAGGVQVVRLDAARAATNDFPRLARIGAKLLRGFTETLASAGVPVTLTDRGYTTQRFGDWKDGLSDEVAIARYRAAPMKGGVLVSVPPKLISRMVDRLYGGDGLHDRPHGQFGAAEHRLFARMAGDIGEVLDAGWLEVMPVTPTRVGEVYVAEEVVLTPPDHQVIVQEFAVASCKHELGSVAVLYPAASLRGIAALHADDEDDAVEIDPVWQARLADAVLQTSLPIRTVLARPTVPLSMLVNLSPGDIIPMTLPAHVPLTAAGKLFAHGTIGEANGYAAIKIEKLEHGANFDD